MSNIIREIFVEDHVQQVSRSIKETLRDLTLLLHIMCGYQCDKAVNKNDTREVI